ncbi:MAG TPA: biotin/lipoyl-containing protein, partial [Vicinamibacterales bacterium]
MGESIAEGTIVRWIKNVGDAIDKDEPLFEISTDKVDAEIPSPSAGVLKEIKVGEGKTVPIQTVVGVIDAADGAAAAKAPAPAPAAAKAPEPAKAAAPVQAAQPAAAPPPPASKPAAPAASGQITPPSRPAGERIHSSP